jgi:two-component system, OmpR family, sensor histidine kinase KdpD
MQKAKTRVKDNLLSMTAHEIRLPLSHIKCFVSSLRRSDVEWDDETRDSFLGEIECETERLEQLVEELLDASRASHAMWLEAPPRRATSAAALIEGGLDRVRNAVGQHQFEVDVPPALPDILADAPALERVLANLVHNATTYPPPGSTITVSARVRGSELELLVDDEGPGIPIAQRQRVFEHFFRLEASERSATPGTGLGLAMCRSIVIAHGGRISVGERPGGGARFTVALPLRAGGSQSVGPCHGQADVVKSAPRSRRRSVVPASGVHRTEVGVCAERVEGEA